MGIWRIEVRIFAPGQRKPIVKMDFDETTIGQLPGEVARIISDRVREVFAKR